LQERLAVFIDGSNLYNGMRENLSNTRVNLAELVRQLRKDRKLVRTYYYNRVTAPDSLRHGAPGQAPPPA
jgi:uncharacterized LabA/DUF88 family protein